MEVKVKELTIEQMMEKYPYLKNFSNYILFTTEDEVNLLRNSEKIKIDSNGVSVEFLKRILNNDFYFEYASRYFSNQINKFMVSCIKNGDIGISICYSKIAIIKGIEQLILSGKIVLEPYEQQRYKFLKNNISFESFLEKYKGKNYDVEVDV